MKKEYVFAIRHEKPGNIIDARNPYEWEDVGKIVLDEDEQLTDAIRAAHNIPADALCVACGLLDA